MAISQDRLPPCSSTFDSIQKQISEAIRETRHECGSKADFVLPYVEDVSELLYFENQLLESVWIENGTSLLGKAVVNKEQLYVLFAR